MRQRGDDRACGLGYRGHFIGGPGSTWLSGCCSAVGYCILLILASGAAAGVVTRCAAESSHHRGKEACVGVRLAADLTWTQAERDYRFAHMESEFPVHVVSAGHAIHRLHSGTPLHLQPDILSAYMKKEHLAGVLVLQDGFIRAERYGLGFTRVGHWTSFSVTKAITDTLVGVAIQRGAIRSLDDQVTRYIPEMQDSAYEGVTVRQLITMTSGVRWNENYVSRDADNVLLYRSAPPAGKNQIVEYMRRLPRESAPETRWVYNTGETDLLGVLLRRATGQSLADQLSQAIWKPYGMERDASWIASGAGIAGEEFGGSGVSASLRDFGRFGQWVLEGGDGAVDPDWFAIASQSHVDTVPGHGYGYGWWPQGDGSFAALGIFGQSILIDPRRRLVIVTLGSWTEATGAEHSAARAEFWRRVEASVDGETARP
jgi:CubicO group peptidase (beta-lactamase class C family)